MKKVRSPQEKKRLSLQKDRRNAYGENDKSSRKAIPKNKALANRRVRKTDKQNVARSMGDPVALETLTKRRLKPDWKKDPDVSLGQHISRRKGRAE